MRIFLFADGSLERDGFLRNLENLAHLRHGNVHALGNLFRSGFAAEFLHQLPLRADELIDGLDHVHGNADRARLVGNGARDGLANPPRGVSRELIAAAPLELIHRLHQADVALLNQIQELQAAVGVLLGDGNHEAKIGLDQLLLGLLGLHLAANDNLKGTLEFSQTDFAGVRNLFQLGAACT